MSVLRLVINETNRKSAVHSKILKRDSRTIKWLLCRILIRIVIALP